MGRCRWVFAGSMIAPVLFSSYGWLCCLVLAPLVLALVVAAALLLGALRHATPVFGWRHGVRPATDEERDAVWEALVPARSLRGRGQPTVWVLRRGGRHASRVTALTGRALAVTEPMLVGLLDRQVDPSEFTAAALHALGARRLRDRVGAEVVELFCLPWAVPAAVVDQLVVRWGGVRLIRFLWQARFVTAGIAIVQQAQAGRPGTAVGVAAVLALTYLHPWCRTRWAGCLLRAGDDRVTGEGFGPIYAGMLRRSPATGLAAQHRLARLESRATAAR